MCVCVFVGTQESSPPVMSGYLIRLSVSPLAPLPSDHNATIIAALTHADAHTHAKHKPDTHQRHTHIVWYVLDLVHEHSIQTHPHTHSFSEQISTHPSKHAWRFWQRFTMVPILCWNTEIPHRLMLFLKSYLGCSYTGLCAIIFKQLHCNHCNSECMIKPNNIFTQ